MEVKQMTWRWIALMILVTHQYFGQNSASIDSLIIASWEASNENLNYAIELADQAIEKGMKAKDESKVAKAKSYKAVYLDLRGETAPAVDLFNQAIAVQINLEDTKGLSFSYNNLGLLYFMQYDYSQAKYYLKKSLEIDLKISDSISAAGSMVNLGIIASNLDSLQLALKYYGQAESIYETEGDTLMMIITQSNRAKIYFQQEEYETSLAIYIKAFEFLEKVPGKYPEKITNLISKANCYLQLKEFKKGLDCAEEAILLASDHHLPERLQFAYEIKHELLYASGQYKASYDLLQIQTALKDSLVNVDRTATIANLQLKYDVAEKEKKLSDQILAVQLEKTKSAKLELKNKDAAVRNIILIGILLLVLILAIILAVIIRQKSSINKLLKERNNAIQENLEQKEVMLGETHHRIKNNLQLISSILDLKLRSLNAPDAVDALSDAKRRVESVAILHRFMYMQEDPDAMLLDVFIRQLCEEMTNSFNYENRQVHIETNLTPIQTKLSVALPLGLIIVEVITNAFKYAQKDDQEIIIKVSIEQKDGTTMMVIQDNGPGITTDFEVLKKESFGFRMINSLSRQLKASWSLDALHGTKHIFVFKKQL